MNPTDQPGEEPPDLELLLPWYVNGTLGAEDRQRIERALAQDADLSRKYAAMLIERDEVSHLAESRGAPSRAAITRLFNALDREPERRGRSLGDWISWMTPKRLGIAAAAAACAVLVVQAGLSALTAPQPMAGTLQSVTSEDPADGLVALVKFNPDASVAEINTLLDTYDATIVAGPKSDTYRLRASRHRLGGKSLDWLIDHLRAERIVGFVRKPD